MSVLSLIPVNWRVVSLHQYYRCLCQGNMDDIASYQMDECPQFHWFDDISHSESPHDRLP